ncbi:acyltransferase [Qipengyuania xiapuensis]|uniref:Acyltransferase n=1 Tax=Qipengyuania xiapuensis TaxID=2867236 RepID=A0ABX8ZWC8_9SPHN|nr:acyltransferase [Qipengyuania xiapuensis]QZD91443.1 acyltransferase [Qipengyuania xiapuensis]
MKTTHLSQLDGLRGFAALVVVISHCAAFGFLPSSLGRGLGQMGVALFFCLSGFLMAYLYREKALNPASLKDYAINRATRVLPLYYLVATFVGVCFLAFDVSLLKVFSWQDVIGNMFLLKGSSVLWTIPVEVHFYVVFVALWFASNSGKFLKSIALLAAAQISALVLLYLIDIRYGPVLFSWLHLFLFGSLIGAYYEPLKRRLEKSRQAPLIAGLGWLALLLMVIAPPEVRRDLGFTVLVNYLDPITVGYPMLLLFCTVFLLGPFALFKTPLLRWYGKISYSLYLLHPFVIDGATALAERGVFPPVIGFPLVLGVATLLAAVSFYWFEHPVQIALRTYFTRKEARAGLA